MKKQLCFLLVTLIFLLSGCDFINFSSPSNSLNTLPNSSTQNDSLNSPSNPSVITAVAQTKKYSVKSPEEIGTPINELKYSFKDSENWYYLFYLGQVLDVPLEQGAYYQYDGNPYEKQFQTTTISTETISKNVSVASQKCTSWMTENSLSAGLEAEVKVEEKLTGLSAGIKSTLETGFTEQISGSESNTWEESYETGHEFSSQYTETTTFAFTENTPHGYYRYIMVGVIDIYATVIYNPSENKYTIGNIENLLAYGYKLDYSANDPTFSNDINYGYLKFDTNQLKYLKEPTIYYEKNKDGTIEDFTETLPTQKEVYKNTTALTIVASGNYFYPNATDWGLSHDADTIDLSNYSQYMNGNYIWRFTISIDIQEEDDGYQEIYLYNELIYKGSVSSSDTYSKDDALTCGLLVYEQSINGGTSSHDKFTYNIDFEVTGSSCKSKMYIRYGAHGDFSDKWIRENIIVKLTITQK